MDIRGGGGAIAGMLPHMSRHFLDPGQSLLDGRFPLPLCEPFTTAQARRAGLTVADLSRLVFDGYLRRLVQGVFVATQVPDSLQLRARALRLVVPPGAVVTDRTAGWLHGAELVLEPGAHLVVPKVSVFHTSRGGRLRNDLAHSGQRMMPPSDIVGVNGLLVTTPLRTACDLGRLLRRDQAFAALDQMLRLGAFSQDELIAETVRFRHYRGVVKLRTFAPLADPGSDSPAEAVLRLRWIDLGSLPRPETQVEVPSPHGGSYALDIGAPQLRFAAEYDGEEFHGPERAEHDETRREWMRGTYGWTIVVARKENVFGQHRDIEALLAAGARKARRALGLATTHF